MEEKIAVIGVILEKTQNAERVNTILHDYSDIIIGRMGVPYREKKVSIISVAVCAPADRISALNGRLGQIDGVSVKAAISKH